MTMPARSPATTLAILALGSWCAAGFVHAADAREAGAAGADPAAPATATAPGEPQRPLAWSEMDGKLAWGDCPPIFPPGCKLAVLHGNPAEPGTDVFLRVPAGYTIPAHSHTSAERMVLVSGQLDVTYDGHATVRLVRGEYAYGPAKLAHMARCNGAESCTLFIAFDTAVDALPFDGALTHAPEGT